MWNIFQNFAAANCSSGSFFAIPTWYKYLVGAHLMVPDEVTQTCSLVSLGTDDWVKVVLLVALALLDIALRIAGIVAVGFVIFGGIKYMTSNGDPSQTKVAQESIINALVGVVIAIVATGLVSFIGSRLG